MVHESVTIDYRSNFFLRSGLSFIQKYHKLLFELHEGLLLFTVYQMRRKLFSCWSSYFVYAKSVLYFP